jgi:riboflavin synthase
MFTGIIEADGTIAQIEDRETTRRFRIVTDLGAACLTVVDAFPTGFSVDVIGTTLDRTVSGAYLDGTRVNLERAVRLGGRLDGHLVQGHIDGTGHLRQCIKDGEYWLMDFELPPSVADHTVERGSIAINGVSLTVSGLEPAGICRIGVIPFTYEHTNLGDLEPGAAVNLEGDLIGKYVGKMLAARGN